MKTALSISQVGFTFLPSKKAKPLLKSILWKRKSNSGFTLVELLVAIVIIVILSTLGIASFNSASSRNELDQSAREIVALARKLRTDAVAAVKPEGLTNIVTGLNCQTGGVIYGTWIGFRRDNGSDGYSNYKYGTSCWSPQDQPAVNYSPDDTIANFKENTVGGPTDHPSIVVFFAFNGDVYLYRHALGPIIEPTRDRILSNAASVDGLDLQGAPANYASFNIVPSSDPNVYTSPIKYTVTFNSAGLICRQKATAIATTSCAQ